MSALMQRVNEEQVEWQVYVMEAGHATHIPVFALAERAGLVKGIRVEHMDFGMLWEVKNNAENIFIKRFLNFVIQTFYIQRNNLLMSIVFQIKKKTKLDLPEEVFTEQS